MSVDSSNLYLISFKMGTECSAYPVRTAADEAGYTASPESLDVYRRTPVDRSGPGPDPASSSSPYPAPRSSSPAPVPSVRSLGVRPPFHPEASRIQPG